MKVLAVLLLLLVQDPDVDALLKQLSDDSIEVREKATATLLGFAEKVEARLNQELASAKGEVKTRLETLLEKIRDARNRRAALPPLESITIEAVDKPARAAFQDFATRTGFRINLDNVKEGSVNVRIKDAPPLQALDALCDAAGVHYSLDGHAGRRGAPEEAVPGFRLYLRSFEEAARTYVRHYSIRATQVSLQRSIDFRGMESSHATVQMELLWPPTLRPSAIGKLQVNEAFDEKGARIYDRTQDRMVEMIRPGRDRRSVGLDPGQRTFSLSLSKPPAGLEKISRLKGEVELRYLINRKILGFKDPANQVGEAVEFDGARVTLKSFSQEGQTVRVSLDVTGIPVGRTAERTEGMMDRVISVESIVLNTEDGSGQRSMLGGGGGHLRVVWMGVKSTVKGLEFEVDAEYLSDAFEFELKDIPFPK